MKRLRHLFVFLWLFALITHVHAQERTITGNVVDADGEPVIGATILIKGTTDGTTSDIDGNFSLSVPPDAILIISSVGFGTQEISVNNRTSISVSMSDDVEQLQEVVITALGFEEDKDELGYATSTVGTETIQKAAENNILNALSGKATGLRVTRNSGDPGAGAYFQIRGLSTITRDGQPLIVVDGIPISNDTRGNGNGRTAQQSRFNDINPNDIQSISILKGASAAALWGTRALGGVVYITTKSGQKNSQLEVKYTGTYSIDVINRKYPLQSRFGQGDNGVYNQRARDSWGDEISERSGGGDEFDTSGEFYIDQTGEIYYPIVTKNSQQTFREENFDQIFQTGGFFENNVSVTGGNANSSVFLSLGDLNQEGIIRNNSDYRRTTARLNVNHDLSDKVEVKVTTNYSKTTSNRIRRGASSSGLYLGLLRTPADFDNAGYRGDYYAGPDAAPVPNRHRSYREPLGADATATYNNPRWTINEQENLADVDRFISSLQLTAKPMEWLELIGRAGIDQYSEFRQQFYTPGSAAGEFNQGTFIKETARSSIFNMDYIAKAQKIFNPNFDGSILVGFNYNQRKLVVDGTEANNFIQFFDVESGIRDIDNSLLENRIATSSFGQERTAGVYTSAEATLFGSLFLNATLRAETASTFGDNPDNTFLFPSASAAWQFSDLGVFDNLPISFGKLRVSYGEVGVQPQRYQTSSIFVSPTYGDQWGGDLNASLYGNGSFVASRNRGNSDLLPERKKEIEVGTDLRFLNDRLSFSATYFKNTTTDNLLDLPVANTRGYDEIYTNGAEIENRGVELELGYSIVQNQDWNWNVSFLYTRLRNEVTDLLGVESIVLGGLAAVNSRAIEGEPLGVLWGSRTLRDEDGNIVFDANGFPVQDEAEGIIGDPNPDWQGSLISSVSYKNFTLSLLFETFQGADIFAGTKSVLYDLGTWDESAQVSVANQNLLTYDGSVVPAGTTFRGKVYNFGAGPVALTESWYNGDGGFFSGGNDELYIEDGSWTRLREISLSYRTNPEWLDSNLGINSAEFTVTGRNLILWTDFEGNDPDTNLDGVSKARGIDYFNNPSTKSYVFSVTLTF